MTIRQAEHQNGIVFSGLRWAFFFCLALLFVLAVPQPAAAAERLEIPLDDSLGLAWDPGMLSVVLGCLLYLLLFIFCLVMVFLMREKKKRVIFLLSLICLVLLGSFAVIRGLHDSSAVQDPLSVAYAQYETEPFQPCELSTDQRTILTEFSKPHGFVVLFTSAGRQETWFYYDQGLVLDFLGGIEIRRWYNESLAGISTARTAYTPHDFAAGMTPGTALSVANLDHFLMEPLGDELVDNGTLYFGRGIAMGFVEDRLYYVETFAAEDD